MKGVNPHKASQNWPRNVCVAMDKSAITSRARLKMYKQRRFGIDWGVGPSTSIPASKEQDWEASMARMWKLCRKGGLVFVPARNTPVDGGIVGQVPPGADIELRDYEASDGGTTVTMKTLKLFQVRETHPDDETGLFNMNYGHHTVHEAKTHPDMVIESYKKLY